MTPTSDSLMPGTVALARVLAPHEGQMQGKQRPVILVSTRDAATKWAAMGLTTKATYADGQRRTPLEDWEAAGLNGPGFMWGGRLVILPLVDIGRVLGSVSWSDAAQMCRRFLSRREGDEFLTAVTSSHWPTTSVRTKENHL